MKFVLSIDDFHPKNVELAKLIKSYGLEDKTIFFIDLGGRKTWGMNGWDYEESSNENIEQIKELSKIGFSVNSHNLWHDNSLKEKSYEEQRLQIFESKKIIEETTGKPCKHYCPNRGRYNDQILELIKEAGYKYIRTTKVFDIEPIKEGINHTTFHLCPIRPEYKDCPIMTIFHDQLDKCIEEDGTFKYWFHQFEIEKYGLRKELESTLRILSKLV